MRLSFHLPIELAIAGSMSVCSVGTEPMGRQSVHGPGGVAAALCAFAPYDGGGFQS